MSAAFTGFLKKGLDPLDSSLIRLVSSSNQQGLILWNYRTLQFLHTKMDTEAVMWFLPEMVIHRSQSMSTGNPPSSWEHILTGVLGLLSLYYQYFKTHMWMEGR